MKKLLFALPVVFSLSAFADVQLQNLSKDDVEDVSVELGGNFAHTTVAAPETDGGWGIEFGVMGGKTNSPKFSDVVDASGGDGSDFKTIYHAGAMARVHLPFDIFAEATYLPAQDISDVEIKNQTFAAGWNFGGFFNWPVDVALGFDYGTGKVKFHQDGSGGAPTTDVQLETKTTVGWIGVSKSFWLITPYAKIGQSKITGDLKADGDILGYKIGATHEIVSLTGMYWAAGLNFQLAFLKLGAEFSQIQEAKRFSGKLSFDF
jgi:hypothetical protein